MLRPVDIPGIPNANGGDGSDIGAVELTPIFVTTVDDHDDGTCSVGDCTLREAINLANAQSGNDTIAFAAGVSGTIQLGSELPQLYTSMVIAGPGANVVTVRRNTAPAYRIFVIANPPQNDPVVTISWPNDSKRSRAQRRHTDRFRRRHHQRPQQPDRARLCPDRQFQQRGQL